MVFLLYLLSFFFFQAEDGIRDTSVTGVQTCALPISIAPIAIRISFARFRAGSSATTATAPSPMSAKPPGSASMKRSEERRVGKECRSRWGPRHQKKKNEAKIEASIEHDRGRSSTEKE